MRNIRKVSLAISLGWIFSLTGLALSYAAGPYVGNSKLTPPADAHEWSCFGKSVDIAPDGSSALVGNPCASSIEPADAYYFSPVSPSTTGSRLKAGDGTGGDDFGHAVVLSDDGTTAVIGAQNHDLVMDSPNASAYHGAAYIFARSGNSWMQKQKITSNAPVNEGLFGCSVDVSDDGNTIVVGSCSATGEAHVFFRSGSAWSFQAELIPDPFQADAAFGQAVAISGDGNTVLVGSFMHTVNGNNDQGAAFVYVRSGTSWSRQATLTGSDGAEFDSFGTAVDLSDDGNTAIVGASWKDAAYIFTRSGETWTQRKKLIGSNDDHFGQSVALSNNGNIAVVGANFAKVAYLFIGGGSTWTLQQKLVPGSNPEPYGFGISVALSDDGQTVLVGANETGDGGVVYIFRPYVPMPGTSLLLLK